MRDLFPPSAEAQPAQGMGENQDEFVNGAILRLRRVSQACSDFAAIASAFGSSVMSPYRESDALFLPTLPPQRGEKQCPVSVPPLSLVERKQREHHGHAFAIASQACDRTRGGQGPRPRGKDSIFATLNCPVRREEGGGNRAKSVRR